MEIKVTIVSCEEMEIDGKKYYKVFAVLPNGSLVRIRGFRSPVKPQTVAEVELKSSGDKGGFSPYLQVKF